MDGDVLPRLPARHGKPLVGSHPHVGASSARQRVAKQPRASLPRSAGTSSPQRLRVRQSAPVPTGDATSIPTDTDTVVFIPSHRQAVVATRPSSVRATPRKSRVSQTIVSDSPTCSSNAELIDDQIQQGQWHAMQSENEQLRHEIILLQQRLVEKIRGGSKVLVGGGQFRATGAPLPVPKQPPSSSIASVSVYQSCGSCSTMRAALKKQRDGQEQTQQTLMLRTAQLEHAQGVWQTEIQERDDECSNLQDRIRYVEQREAAAFKQVADQQREIERLESELSGIAGRMASFTFSRLAETTEVASQCEFDYSCGEDKLGPESSSVEERWRDIGTQTCREVHAKQDFEQAIETLRHELQDAAQNYQLEVSRLRKENRENERYIGEVEHQLQDVKDVRDQLHQQITMMKHQLDESRRREASLSVELSRLSEHAAKCEHDLMIFRTEVEIARQGYQDELRRLQEKLALREADASQGDKERGILMTKIIHTEEMNDTLTKTLDASQVELNERKAREKLFEAQLGDLQNAVDAANQELQIFQARYSEVQQLLEAAHARLSAAEAEAEAVSDTIRRLKAAHTAELEHAVQSLVRLCVVAPTVNVHLNSNNGSAVVACKAALPEKQLRQVVEVDVLPHFSTIFLQLKEGMSPNGGAMDPWVQGLLRDMQENLAVHLQKLYSAAQTSPAGSC